MRMQRQFGTIVCLALALSCAFHTRVAAEAPAPSDLDPRAQLEAAMARGNKPLSAAQAGELAAVNSLATKRDEQTEHAASADEARAQLMFYPDVTLSGRYTRLSRVPNRGLVTLPQDYFSGLLDRDPGPGGPRPFDTAVASVFDRLTRQAFPQVLDQVAFRAELSYPVSALFLQLLPSYRAAKQWREVARANVISQRRKARLSGCLAYYEYARARAVGHVAEGSVVRMQEQLREVSALVAAGNLSEADQKRAESNLQSAQVTLANARGNVAITRAQLARVLQTPLIDDVGISLDFSSELNLPEPQDSIIQRALRSRPEVHALRGVVSARENNVSIAAAAKWPDLVLGAGLDVQNPAPRVSPQKPSFGTSWDVGARVTWSAQQALAAGRTEDVAEAELAKARIDQRDLEAAVVLEVTQAYVALQAARAAMGSAQSAIASAQETYRVRQAQLRAQTILFSAVVDAEYDLQRALLQLIDAAINQQVARARLTYAEGTAAAG